MTIKLKYALPVAVVFLGIATAPAQTVAGESGLAVNIPDNDASGILRTVDVTGLADNTAYQITASLDLSGTGLGGYGGDIYAYLSHQSDDGTYTMCVLLNRIGRDSLNSSGYSDNSINITLDDSALQDVHQSGQISALIGTWQPDGRDLSPFDSITSSPRTTTLDSLGLSDPNGTWNLFIADVQAGGTMQLDSWSVDITPIPEPAPLALAGAGSLILFSLNHLRRSRIRQ